MTEILETVTEQTVETPVENVEQLSPLPNMKDALPQLIKYLTDPAIIQAIHDGGYRINVGEVVRLFVTLQGGR